MTFSPTGSTGLFTVAGTPYTFEVDVTSQQPTRITTADTTAHHIPHGSVTWLQSAGRSFTTLAYAAFFGTVAEFEAIEGVTGQQGSLQTVLDGLWVLAQLKECRKTRDVIGGKVEATLTFEACRIASV
jgi:hypothetical protein